MGRNQIYRGNPEQKHYYLIDNFSGGINTTDVDERVNDFEFRELINVELIEQGKIQNRKGFGELKLFNELLSTAEETIPSQMDNFTPYLFKVINDNSNFLKRLENYDSLTDFFANESAVETDFSLLYVTRLSSVLAIFELFVTNYSGYGYVLHNKFIYSLPPYPVGYTFKKPKITGINLVSLENKLLFNLNEVISGINGIVEINLKSERTSNDSSIVDSVNIINNLNCYMPSPYEVSNIGFNLFSSDPINYISTDTSGIVEIRGSFITTQEDKTVPITKIPKSGVFTLNLITKGNLYDTGGTYIPEQLKLTAYTIDEFGESKDVDISYSLTDVNYSSPIVRFNVSLSLGNSTNAYIRVYKINELNAKLKKVYTSVTNMVNGEKNTALSYLVQTSVKYKTAYYKKPDNPYGYNILQLPAYACGSYSVFTTSAYNLPVIKYKSRASGMYLYDIYTSENKYPEFANMNRYAVFHNMTTGAQEINVCTFGATGIPLADLGDIQLCMIPINLTQITSIDEISPSIGDLYKIDDEVNPVTYYNYNGGTEGTSADFTLVSETLIADIAFDYTAYVELGVVEVNKINAIDISNMNMFKIKDRVVLYGGNTIIFSDINNISYFPNYNYIILPIPTNDSIQKIAYFRGSWMIFTREFIFRMSGTFGQSDFQVIMINDSIGCIAPNSVRSINNTLIFLSRDGLYVIKQNYYMEGLENVEKVDKNIKNIILQSGSNESIVYNEQYWLINKNNDEIINTVKQYYNMEYRSKVFPYVLDEYKVNPENLFIVGEFMCSVKYGIFYRYDLDYTDFIPHNHIEDDIPDYTYKLTITTPNYMLGAATHDKKFKNIYIKTDSEVSVPVYVTVYINNLVWKTPYNFAAVVNELGEIEYREILGVSDITTTHDAESNLILDEETTPVDTIDPDLTLGSFTLGTTKLGVNKYQVHKVVISGKGKSIALKIEQKLNAYFGIQDIGILYKLGKVKESR